jgi:hypothetical protein
VYRRERHPERRETASMVRWLRFHRVSILLSRDRPKWDGVGMCHASPCPARFSRVQRNLKTGASKAKALAVCNAVQRVVLG